MAADETDIARNGMTPDEAQRQLQIQGQLLQAIVAAQMDFVAGSDPAAVFDALLSAMLEATGSEYGFIGEREINAVGEPQLRVIAITDISWDDKSRRQYQARLSATGFYFTNLGGLLGEALRNGQTVISNVPEEDGTRRGLPPSHPALRTFMAVPFFGGSEMIGMIGLANRPAGYDAAITTLLGPLRATAANLLMALRDRRRRMAAEAAVLQERQQLIDILGNTGNVAWSTRLPDFIPIYISPSIAALTGYSVEQLTQPEVRNWVIPEADWEIRDAAEKRALETGSMDVRHRLRCADGSMRWVHVKGVVIHDEAGQPVRMDGTLRDITEVHAARERARQSEALYRAVVEDQEEAIVRFDTDFIIRFANRKYAEFYDLKPADLIGTHLGELLARAEWAAARGDVERLTAAAPIHISEYEKPLPDGSTRWLRWVNRAVLDGAGEVVEYQCVGHDLTDRKQLELDLEKSRARFALVVASSGDGIIDWNFATGEIWFSPRWKEIVGYADDELPNTVETWEKIVHPEDREGLLERAAAYLRNPVGVMRNRARYLHRDGSIVYIDSRVNGHSADISPPTRIVVAVSDVTARVQAEERARKSEAMYRAVVEDQEEAIVRFNTDCIISFVNKKYASFYKVAPEELQGQSLRDLLAPADWAGVQSEIGSLVPGHLLGVSEQEKTLRDGSRRWMRWTTRALPDAEGRIAEYQSVGHDITDRKVLEQELADGRELFGLVVASSGDGIIERNFATNEIWFSPRWKEIFGYSDDELPNTIETWERLIHPDDRDAVLDRRAATARNPDAVLRSRQRYFHRNGSLVYIDSRVVYRPAGPDGALRLVAAHTDVTARVVAEERARKSEAMYRAVVEDQEEAIVRYDTDFIIGFANRKYAAYYNRTPAELQGMHLANLLGPAAWGSIKAELGTLTPVQPTRIFEHQEHLPDGSTRWLRWVDRALLNSEGEIAEYQGVAHDIGDLKRLEQELADGRELFGLVVASSGDGIYDLNVETKEIWYSPRWKEMLGYGDEELPNSYETWQKFAHPEDLPRILDLIEVYFRNPDGVLRYQFRFIHRDGSIVYIDGRMICRQRGPAGAVRVVGAHTDITARVLAEGRAHKSEALYRAVVEDQDEAIVRFRPDSTIVFANKKYAGFYNKTPEEMWGIRLDNMLAPQEWVAIARKISGLTPTRPTSVHEFEKPLPGGKSRWLRWVTRAIHDAAGELTEVQCVGHDIGDRKRLERELEAGRELFGLVVASSGDGIFEFNIETGEIWFSARWKEMFGYADEELPNVRATWDRLLHPDDRQQMLARSTAYFANPSGVLRMQLRYLHHNGSIVFVDSRMICRQSGPTGALRIVGAHTDVTAKVLAEERMRDAIESLSDAFAWFDADDRLIMHNRRYLEFFPFLRDLGDLRGVTFLEMVSHPQGETSRAANPEAYIAARMRWHREGGTFELSLNGGGSVRVSERRTADQGTVSIWSDITELKRAERRLMDAVATMQEGFLLLGPDGRIVLSNQRCRELYPLVSHLLEPGTLYEDFLREGVARGQFMDAMGRGEDYIRDAVALLDDETQIRVERELAGGRWVLISQRRMSDGSVVSIRTELTEQKRREAELVAARRQLEKQASALADLAEKLEQARLSAVGSSRAKTRFLAHMSHELRTPLNAILGFAKLIDDELFGPIGTPKYKEYIGLIQESGTHLLSLINDVLDLSKVEAGRMELDRQWVSVAALAASSTRLMDGLAKDRGVTLTVEIAADCRQLYGDERTIKQMIINLLSNALKFTPAGGQVSLYFAALQGTMEGLPGAAVSGATITVTDTGIGMSPDDMVKALDPFGQVDGEIARQHQGTGLGLPLVKAMAEAHGGSLALESEPGMGTTITVYLPGADGGTPPPAPSPDWADMPAGGPALSGSIGDGLTDRDIGPGLAEPAAERWDGPGIPAAQSAAARPRVLLAEDNQMNQRLFSEVLANLPIEMDCVSDGAAAVERVLDGAYDLILMDIQMPKLGGLDAVQHIRGAGGKVAATPIIALTAHAMDGDRERYLAAGMTDHLTKPVDPATLLEMVARYLKLDLT